MRQTIKGAMQRYVFTPCNAWAAINVVKVGLACR